LVTVRFGIPSRRLISASLTALRMLVIPCRQGARMALAFSEPKAILTLMLTHSDHPVSVG
jgi:hypothetical protein